MAKATFGAGCFWGIEAAYRKVAGVTDVKVGYAGGTKDEPTYQEVCSGQTGHAEVVEVDFNPDQVSYDELLDLFWQIHDPTQVNRQGPDVGTQYRSAIYFHDDDQQAAALASKQSLEQSGRFGRPIATEITAASTFWMGEDYHQRYFEKAGRLRHVFGQ